jgi:hypothetical protein
MVDEVKERYDGSSYLLKMLFGYKKQEEKMKIWKQVQENECKLAKDLQGQPSRVYASSQGEPNKVINYCLVIVSRPLALMWMPRKAKEWCCRGNLVFVPFEVLQTRSARFIFKVVTIVYQWYL